MARCKHGIFLPENPKYKAEDVCSYCKAVTEPTNGYLNSRVVSAIMSDRYFELSDSELHSIMTDPEFDHTVQDYVAEEIESRKSNESE
jgi:hypothetical protein